MLYEGDVLYDKCQLDPFAGFDHWIAGIGIKQDDEQVNQLKKWDAITVMFSNLSTGQCKGW